MYYNHLVGALEAVLFTAGEPISVTEIADRRVEWAIIEKLPEVMDKYRINTLSEIIGGTK